MIAHYLGRGNRGARGRAAVVEAGGRADRPGGPRPHRRNPFQRLTRAGQRSRAAPEVLHGSHGI